MESLNGPRAVYAGEIDARLRRALGMPNLGMVLFDNAGRIREANDAFLAMSGHSREEVLLGLMRGDDVFPAGWFPPSREIALEIERTGRIGEREIEYRRADGTLVTVAISAVRISETEWLACANDISEHRRIAELYRRSRDEIDELLMQRMPEGEGTPPASGRAAGEKSRQASMRELVSAQEEERRRISRELHDVVGQHLTALMLGLRAISEAPAAGTVLAELREMQLLTETIGKEIHDLALELRPTALDDLGLLRTLSNFVDTWSARYRIEVDFHADGWGPGRAPSPVETAIYRIVCEAFNNVLRHARAKHVSLILKRGPDQAVAIVEDDGVGFDVAGRSAATTRLGLLGMSERAALVGGEAKIESTPGSGTTVFVRIPLNPEATPADEQTSNPPGR